MNFTSKENLRGHGFSGFQEIKDLWLLDSAIPKKPGVYAVVAPYNFRPIILSPNSPKLPIGHIFDYEPESLKECWVENAAVLYFGMAKRQTLHSRLRKYLNTGRIGRKRKGGRAIWQLEGSKNLMFAWRITEIDEDPEKVENDLLAKFAEEHHTYPFANQDYRRGRLGAPKAKKISY